MPSFDTGPGVVVTDARGQRVHRDVLAHTERLARTFYEVAPGVWSFVGNGLSNQSFVEGPDGIIAIDTGECIEEMREALTELRQRTAKPIVAVLYTHFHYVGGTRAVFEEAGGPVPIYGHEGIPGNLARVTSEVQPAYASGIAHQFGMRMPTEGPDGVVNVGLGLFFRNPGHAPFTPGYIDPTEPLRGGESLRIAGLTVEVTHAPSDADDSVTFWFPDLGVAVNNLVWPTLFNIFAIRGEAYRDPQILLRGIDHLVGLSPAHLLGAHGAPLSGRDEIRARVTRYRDSIQFLWDQTVRGMNRGLTADQMAASIRLPTIFETDSLTREFYGVAEHHVRQIAMGVRGWFDGDPAKLFPLAPAERATRLVRGLGGAESVRRQVAEARASEDLRWGLELAAWLVARPDAEAQDRELLAAVLRDIAQRTTAANIRNWCLTRARDLDGSTDLTRMREHRLRAGSLAAMRPAEALALLRVMLDPARAEGLDHHLAFRFAEGETVGLHLRNGISALTDGLSATATIALAYADLVRVLAGPETLGGLLASGAATITGDAAAARAALACFDVAGLAV
ncbi:MAG: alkyl sulfatase dimerization domain-containing protein [Phenylobacterium sp.]